jgi:hypothetical protein
VIQDDETDLRSLHETLDPKARDDLRRVLVRDHADRDAIASRLMRYRDQNGQGWADIIAGCSPASGPTARRDRRSLIGARLTGNETESYVRSTKR